MGVYENSAATWIFFSSSCKHGSICFDVLWTPVQHQSEMQLYTWRRWMLNVNDPQKYLPSTEPQSYNVILIYRGGSWTFKKNAAHFSMHKIANELSGCEKRCLKIVSVARTFQRLYYQRLRTCIQEKSQHFSCLISWL